MIFLILLHKMKEYGVNDDLMKSKLFGPSKKKFHPSKKKSLPKYQKFFLIRKSLKKKVSSLKKKVWLFVISFQQNKSHNAIENI